MFEIFSTREIAIIIWSSILIIGIIIIVKPKAFFDLLKVFFDYKIQIPLWLMFIYITGITICLYYFKIWNLGLLKDTVIWSIVSATVLFFNMNKAKDFTYFKPILIGNLKAIVILEFITNFYTFNFITEIIVIPIMTFVGILQIYAKHSARTNPEHLKVASCLKNFFVFVGIFIFIYISYETYKYYEKLLTIQNIKSLLLPFALSVFLIPFLYFLALYMNYEILFIRIPFLIKEEKKQKKLKLNILLYANINLNKLHKISTDLNWDIVKKYGVKKSLKKILK
jgi:hypothetical protein